MMSVKKESKISECFMTVQYCTANSIYKALWQVHNLKCSSNRLDRIIKLWMLKGKTCILKR